MWTRRQRIGCPIRSRSQHTCPCCGSPSPAAHGLCRASRLRPLAGRPDGVMASRATARERIAVDWVERLIGCEPMGAADFGGGAFLRGAGSALFADGAGETATSFHGDVRPRADFPTYGAARLFEGWSCRDAAHCDHLSLISLSLHRHQIFESDIPAQDGQPTLIAANESPSLRTFQEAGGGVALSVRIS